MSKYRIKIELDGDKWVIYKLQIRILFVFWWTIDSSINKEAMLKKKEHLEEIL